MARAPAARARFGSVKLAHGVGAALAIACARAAPPSQFPTADAAIARMRQTYTCSRGVRGESKVDYFGEQGRVRVNALFLASRPERLRIDVFSPFGVTLSTLTADGHDFALLDLHDKRFFRGPATECNVQRFLRVPVPPFALVSLLNGEAPVLVHQPGDAQLAWSSGAYTIRIRSLHDATEEIRLEPAPSDWNRPWSEQRLRVREVRVDQRGIELYRAELDDFSVAHTARPRVDPDGIDPDIPPSGPPCDAEVADRIHIQSDASAQDVVLVHHDVVHNPPLFPGLFRQSAPPGTRVRESDCEN